MAVKVAKFGGSSLADGSQFRKVLDIVAGDPARKYIVPSAPGKRNGADFKVTDMLYRLHGAVGTPEYEDCFGKIVDRFEGIIAELQADVDLAGEFAAMDKALRGGAGADYAASRGEYLNGILLAAVLGVPFIDAADVVCFSSDGRLDDDRTYHALRDALQRHERAVIPGFYGSKPDGTIKTFSRGGSDISGSLVAWAAGADLYENWTDVSGVMSADPRIVPNARTIHTITYHELRELSYMGATVLHEDAIFPVRRVGIPINIRNTNAPMEQGTLIVAQADEALRPGRITGIAGRKGFSVITVSKAMMNIELGFGRRVLEALESAQISFEHLPTGIDTLSVVLESKYLDGRADEVLKRICDAVQPDQASIEHGLALVATVGRGMVRNLGTAARLFEALAKADINVRMIDQGSSEMNIIVGIAQEDFDKAIRAIHTAFED